MLFPKLMILKNIISKDEYKEIVLFISNKKGIRLCSYSKNLENDYSDEWGMWCFEDYSGEIILNRKNDLLIHNKNQSIILKILRSSINNFNNYHAIVMKQGKSNFNILEIIKYDIDEYSIFEGEILLRNNFDKKCLSKYIC